jgi:sortase A
VSEPAAVRLLDEHAQRVVELRVDTSPRQAPQRVEGGGRWAAAAMRALAAVLITVGALALIDGAVTLVWQEPISALYAKLRQDQLGGALQSLERAAPTPSEQRTLASLPAESARVSFLAGELEHRAHAGSPVGRIVIPRIGASFVVVRGTGSAALESGPGIFGSTNFPGIPGTTAIAGHRTTFLAPFRHIDALKAGNVIRLNMPYAHFTYTVIGHRVVAPTNVQAAVADVGYSRLVLSACTPLFSAAKRLLVFARLTRMVPVGAARTLSPGVVAQPLEATQVPSVALRPLPPVLESLDSNVVSPLV